MNNTEQAIKTASKNMSATDAAQLVMVVERTEQIIARMDELKIHFGFTKKTTNRCVEVHVMNIASFEAMEFRSNLISLASAKVLVNTLMVKHGLI